jgi:hypothetical protein
LFIGSTRGDRWGDKPWVGLGTPLFFPGGPDLIGIVVANEHTVSQLPDGESLNRLYDICDCFKNCVRQYYYDYQDMVDSGMLPDPLPRAIVLPQQTIAEVVHLLI